MVIGKSATARVEFVQGNEAGELQSLFVQKIRALVDENAERGASADKKPPLGIADVQMTSFIHGFMVMLVVTTEAELWPGEALGNVTARFWPGGDAESLGDYQEAAVASLRNGSGLRGVRTGIAAGVTGRVMAFMAGIRQKEVP